MANNEVEEDMTSPGRVDGTGRRPDKSPGLVHRLGILELGWHARENVMPAKILRRIEDGQAIQVPSIISVLARLCEQDTSMKSAYLCHPGVQYITKTRGEGSFCGYRNIQMLISYVIGSKGEGDETFPDGIPSILQIQDLIEGAWDQGINADGRLQTGGIRGTRKHIGTPEAQALFKSLSLSSTVGRYSSTSTGTKAWDLLLDYVEKHFTKTLNTTPDTNVHRTEMPPIYLQRPRHSMIIVGLEMRANRQRNLLVLDPGLTPSPRMIQAAQAAIDGKEFSKRITLRPYRRGKWQLGLFKEFETLTPGSQS